MHSITCILLLITQSIAGLQQPAHYRARATAYMSTVTLLSCFLSEVVCGAASHVMSPCAAVLCTTGVTINTYRVIYNLIDDVKAAMEGKLRQVEERLPVGSATVSPFYQAV